MSTQSTRTRFAPWPHACPTVQLHRSMAAWTTRCGRRRPSSATSFSENPSSARRPRSAPSFGSFTTTPSCISPFGHTSHIRGHCRQRNAAGFAAAKRRRRSHRAGYFPRSSKLVLLLDQPARRPEGRLRDRKRTHELGLECDLGGEDHARCRRVVLRVRDSVEPDPLPRRTRRAGVGIQRRPHHHSQA